ncbi:ATP-binding protein [Oceanirhabdus sp. W0125-5]|uniref:ATP-binding protein n=1 Tax=Oceanirhabdus sp. W0125-5 TaxID=2999116 RepID=UPI0022F2EB9E|nr:ATP-binding protein [Oceanirhabdus sp. W0125-5]WBW99686.1 ATP-binding protein [Oceanirhabdus sp. W0125-5]
MIKGYQEKVLNLYEKKRKANIDRLKQRKSEVYAKVPRIKALDSMITKSFIDLSTSPFKNIPNIDTYIQDLKSKITDLRVEKSELLVQHGYPMDYLNEIYECTKCGDTGFIGPKRCECFNKNLVQLYYVTSELKDILVANNFSTFRLDYFENHRFKNMDSPRKNIERILAKSKEYIRDFPFSDENLFFYGSPGTGKTFLTNCIAKELLDNGYLVIYKTSEELIESLKEIKFNKDKILEDALINCDVLIIDDLGTEADTDFTRSELYNLLNKKILNNKKMIISTNFSLEELMNRYSERITSRLFGHFSIHKFYGEDLRIKLNLKRIH